MEKYNFAITSQRLVEGIVGFIVWTESRVSSPSFVEMPRWRGHGLPASQAEPPTMYVIGHGGLLGYVTHVIPELQGQ
jgi:hypothetical protein